MEKLIKLIKNMEIKKIVDKEPKVLTFLRRSNIIDKIKWDSNKILNLESMSFESFKNILIRINLIIRWNNEKRWIVDNVYVGNISWIVSYLPPEDKDYFLKKLYDEILDIQKYSFDYNNNENIWILLYYWIQNIHPFSDWNWRTWRFIYSLLKNNFNLEDLWEYSINLSNEYWRKTFEELLLPVSEIRLNYNKEFFKGKWIKEKWWIFPYIVTMPNENTINNINELNYEKIYKVQKILDWNIIEKWFCFKNYIAYKINEYKGTFSISNYERKN